MNDAGYTERADKATKAAHAVARKLIEAARTSGSEPVVFVAGNAMFPAYRSFPEFEELWQTWEHNGDAWAGAWAGAVDILEGTLNKAGVCLDGGPDGSLYVVDTARFKYRDLDGDDPAAVEYETLSDEWKEIG